MLPLSLIRPQTRGDISAVSPGTVTEPAELENLEDQIGSASISRGVLGQRSDHRIGCLDLSASMKAYHRAFAVHQLAIGPDDFSDGMYTMIASPGGRK